MNALHSDWRHRFAVDVWMIQKKVSWSLVGMLSSISINAPKGMLPTVWDSGSVIESKTFCWAHAGWSLQWIIVICTQLHALLSPPLIYCCLSILDLAERCAGMKLVLMVDDPHSASIVFVPFHSQKIWFILQGEWMTKPNLLYTPSGPCCLQLKTVGLREKYYF